MDSAHIYLKFKEFMRGFIAYEMSLQKRISLMAYFVLYVILDVELITRMIKGALLMG